MADSPDYAALGFRCGLEIHQQVQSTKLFCRCPTAGPVPDDEQPEFSFVRRLRPTQSELGEVDAAALAESRRNRLFEYRGSGATSCLVDADEEPPHRASEDALEVALTMALLLESRPADEIQWMRKIVIDGSNTAGFQRTGLVALGGSVDGVGVQTICLEEDSARKIRDEPDRVLYGLDRLGVPLVEIATDPSLRDGAHAKQVAARLGALLRSTGRVKRGLGTIRQDLNVSIRDGTRVEIKGVQDLASIPHVIDWEVRRQQRLVEVARTLRERGLRDPDLAWMPVDVTRVFRATGATFVKKSLDAGGVVLGHRLPKFHGLIGAARKEDPRLGRELAAHARRDGGLSGLMHGDELPGLGVTDAEVASVRKELQCGPADSFVLVVESATKADRGLRVVLARARQASNGVPGEVRNAEPDRTNGYLRPMPGAARMYPETDVPPSRVEASHLSSLRKRLPPPPETLVAQTVARHKLGAEEARQLVAEGLLAEFEDLAKATDASLAARCLLAFIPDLERKHPLAAERLPAWARETLVAVRAGRFAKEGVPNVLETLASGKATSVEEAVAKLGLGGTDRAAVEARARELVTERSEFILARGREAVGPLMGILMKEFRGRLDGGELNRILAEAVDRHLASQPKN